jgi:hypothetical protein
VEPTTASIAAADIKPSFNMDFSGHAELAMATRAAP